MYVFANIFVQNINDYFCQCNSQVIIQCFRIWSFIWNL